MKRFNKANRAKHTTPMRYHETRGSSCIACWQRYAKTSVFNLIGVPIKERRYEWINVGYSKKKKQ